MSSSPICQTCGSARATATNEGFCAACMIRSALGESPKPTSFSITPETLPRSFGAYELLEEIARGGMGVVYKARQRTLNRIVALKVLIGGAYSSESLLRRFQVEAEAAAGLQHPGIVAIHEFGECDDQPYYTMDYVEGENLSAVGHGQPLEPTRAARYLNAIAKAVSFAHGKGILHRDLKPSNVIIDQNDRPRVADFGLAKRLHDQSEVTLAGQMLGSPNYAPPEQAAGRQDDVGVRSDVYSLGGLLYFLLTGRPPFLAATVQETLRLVFEAEPVSPRVLDPGLPRDLETICLKCLEKDPARRYATAQELSEELGRFERNEPILARPVSRPEQAWRWCARHPALAGLAALVVLSLLTTSVIFYTSARRIERARAQERLARVVAEENLYAANMTLVGNGTRTAAGDDPITARSFFQASRLAPGTRELRGFEWRYYWTEHRSDALAVFEGHHQVVDQAAFSPDGARIASRSLDGHLAIWDATTKEELFALDGVASVGGFTSDSAELIFSRPDNSIWRLDLAGKKISLARAATGRLIAALADGRQAVVFGPDQRPLVISLDDKLPAETVSAPRSDTCVVVSSDGKRAAVAGSAYPGILVIDLTTGRQLAAMLDPRPVTSLALSAEGSKLVSGSFDGRLKIWEVSRGEVTHTVKAFLDPIWGMAFSPDEQYFAAGGNNRRLTLWATSTWRETGVLHGHTSNVRCLAFSPDSQRLVSGAEDDLTMVWPTRKNTPPTEVRHLLRGPKWTDRTPSIDFSPDSQLFTGTAVDGTIKVWRTDTIATVASFPMEARTVAFASDGKSVLGEGYDGRVKRWDLSGREIPTANQVEPRFTNWQTDPLTPEERVRLVAQEFETRAQCRLCEIPSTRDGIFGGAMLTTQSIAMSPDGASMFIGLPQGGIEVWRVATNKKLLEFSAHKLSITALSVSADGRYLASGGLDNLTKLWDAATGKLIATFGGHNRPVWALAFSPDGTTLAAGSCDKEIILCNLTLRRHVGSLALYSGTPQGYEQEVRALRFSPDSNILAAALGDGSVRFFRAAPFSVTDAETSTPATSL